jgi:putative MATE family efflux protein
MQNQVHSHNVLDTDKIGRLLMKLSVPMFIGSVTQVIYAIIDTIFIGHYVGPLGMAGISIAFPLQMFVQGTGMMVGLGGGSLISRLIGQGDRPRAERALGNSLMLSVLFSLVLMAVILPFIHFWVTLIGATENVLPYARDYLTVTYLGVIFNIAGAVLLTLIRSEGNTRIAMISMVTQAGLNILLDWIFIKELKMGIKGAALATLIAQAIAMFYALSYYITKSGYLKLQIANFLPDFKILKSIFAIGISQFAQTLATSIAALMLVKMMSIHGGDAALGAFGILQRIMWFAMMPGQVLGQGMQPILGFNYGAKRYRQALRVLNLTFLYSIILSIASFIVLFFFPEIVLRVFSSDETLIDAGAKAARIIFITMPFFGFFNVGQMVFPSIGKAVESFIIAISRPLIFIIPLTLLLPLSFGLNGVWASFPGADVLTFIMILSMLIPLYRKFRKAAAGPQSQLDTGTKIA